MWAQRALAGANFCCRGQEMPASDYWFLAEVIQDGKKYELKGNFTLKR